MRGVTKVVSMLVLVGALANGAFAADPYILNESASDNYCHLKFPAVTQRSLFTNHPRPKNSSTGDIVDYYGSCDETPTSKDEVNTQRFEWLHDVGE